MPFWRHLKPDAPAASYQHQPLTDTMIAACERKFGVKFPARFLELLRTQNGGLLENCDFKFDGENYGCSIINGLDDQKEFEAVRSCASIMVGWDDDYKDLFHSNAGDPARILIFGDNDYVLYAFDYTHLNASGEPMILWLMLNDGDVRCGRVAGSFSEFLQGQDFGDKYPAVVMGDADNYKILAEGGYQGRHPVSGARMAFSWKICTHRDRFILFTSEEWGNHPYATLMRAEFKKSALLYDHRLAKWEIQEAGGSEFLALVRRAVQRFGPFTKPELYALFLEVGPCTDETMAVKRTIPYNDHWKNSSSELISTAIYSSEREALEETFKTMIESIQREG